MNYMANTRKKRRESKNKIVIGIIIALCIIISIYLLSNFKLPFLSNISGKIVYGVDSVISSIGGFFKEGTSYFGNTKKLNEKIDRLEIELEQARINNLEIANLKVENEDLKEMLKIEEKYNHYEKVYANVITRSYSNWNETFVINKGTADGIKLKQTVISKDGLVGYISEVTEKTSTVVTILDPSSAVSTEIANINKLALVKGDFNLKDDSKLKLINMPIDTEVAEGDAIYTSGIGELYKKGLPIGKIIEVVNKKNDIDRYAVVETFVDFESLDVVGVIIK